ncbi:MAG TPA: helix-turn-helix domain-containing protein [Chitinophagaceae bacterium]|nr:helix-turn-helix domain-containing protein [Chitinophagaceae bacterium]
MQLPMGVIDREFIYIVTSGLLLIIALVVSFRKPEEKDRSRIFLILYFWSFFYSVFITLIVLNYIESVPHLARTGVVPSFLMMPLSYFYVLQNLSPRRLVYKDLLHLIPVLLYFVDYLPFFLLSGDQKLTIYQGLSEVDRRLGFNEGWFMPEYGHIIIRNIQVVGYVIAQYLLIRRVTKHPEHPVLFDNPVLINWMKLLVGSQVLFFLFPMVALVVWGKDVAAGFSNLGPLLVALAQSYFLVYEPRVLYGTSLYFSQPASISELPPSKPVTKEVQIIESEIQADLLSSAQLDEIGIILEEHMNKTQAFLQPGYKLINLSEEVGIPVYKISIYVNKRKGINFFSYLNVYRINHCLEKISLGEHRTKTLEALAEECGFQSRGTFIRAFKQKTGSTPSDYLAARVRG